MAKLESSFRWRTVVEVALISLAIYLVVGAPGFPSISTTQTSSPIHVPVAKARIETLVYPNSSLQCPEHNYDIHIFSSAPLVIYIDGFLSGPETRHLIDISSDKWQLSTVFNKGEESIDESVRKSEKAMIERDSVVQCIERRALSIQGWPQDTFIERLWTQRYGVGGHYAPHYDWATALKSTRRVSTFMVYLQAQNLVGGGTNFPQLPLPANKDHWCQFIECDEATAGVTFKAREGAAVFWENFDSNGRGWPETIHCGETVQKGTKVGLNIWSWYHAGHRI